MPTIELFVKGSNELKISVEIDTDNSVLQLKQKIEEKLKDTDTSAPAETQRLIYAGKVLKDEDLLSTYKLESKHTIHLIRGKNSQGNSAQATSTQGPAVNTASSETPTAQTTSGMGPLPGPLNNPMFAGLFGGFPNAGSESVNASSTASGLPSGGMPNFSDPQFMASMAQMMSNPAMMQMIQSMLPPNLAQTLQNPQLLSMLSNPAMLQAAGQMISGMQSGGATGTSGTPNANPMGGLNFSNIAQLLGNAGGALQSPLGGAAVPPATGSQQSSATTVRPPEELYEQQLKQLQEMGFYNAQENIQALQMFNGSVEAALEYLFSKPG